MAEGGGGAGGRGTPGGRYIAMGSVTGSNPLAPPPPDSCDSRPLLTYLHNQVQAFECLLTMLRKWKAMRA
jgi:hypothetical protein